MKIKYGIVHFYIVFGDLKAVVFLLGYYSFSYNKRKRSERVFKLAWTTHTTWSGLNNIFKLEII